MVEGLAVEADECSILDEEEEEVNSGGVYGELVVNGEFVLGGVWGVLMLSLRVVGVLGTLLEIFSVVE